MWKCASKNIKSVVCKHLCYCRNVPKREAWSDRGSNSTLKSSVLFPGHLSRYYCKNNEFGPSSKSGWNRHPETDKYIPLDGFQRILLNVFKWSGIVAIGCCLLQTITHKRTFKTQLEKCAFHNFSKCTRDEYQKLLYYFTNSLQPCRSVFPKVEGRNDKYSCDPDAEYGIKLSHLEDLEKAHEKVVGTLSNIHGIECIKHEKYREAFFHFEEGAKVYNPTSLYNLGICHEMGLGTSQDLKKAAEMYKTASDLGHPTAMYNLGVFYVHGLGDLKCDQSKARELFQVAAALGQQDAKDALELEKNTTASSDGTCENNIVSSGNCKYSKGYDENSGIAHKKSGGFAYNLFYNIFNNAMKNYVSSELNENSSPLDDSGALDLSSESHTIFA